MRNKLVIAVALVAIVAAVVIVTQAGLPASKTAVAGTGVKFLSVAQNGVPTTEELGSAMIKTSNQKDLIISVTAEAALFTDTKISGKGATDLNDMDRASIQVWAELDGQEVFPGKVTFAERIQTLNGRLSPVITEPCDENGDGIINNTEECWINIPEEVELILDTTNANGFNFLALNVPEGEHTIKVFATISTDESSASGEVSADPKAVVGKRTVIIQEARLIGDAAVGP